MADILIPQISQFRPTMASRRSTRIAKITADGNHGLQKESKASETSDSDVEPAPKLKKQKPTRRKRAREDEDVNGDRYATLYLMRSMDVRLRDSYIAPRSLKSNN